MRRALLGAALATLLPMCSIASALAWDRGDTEIFAVVPNLPGNVPVSIEGLTVGPDGTVYTPSFGFNSSGEVKQAPHLFSFRPNGTLLHDVTLVNSAPTPQPSPHLLGLVFQVSTRNLLICDLAQGIVWKADPTTGKASVFMNTGLGSASGLNALTVDPAGNVYVSDSFQGVIWKTGPNGGPPTAFVTSNTLRPDAFDNQTLIPPFGANGVEFNNEYSAMYVANTAYHSIVKIPVVLDQKGNASTTGSASVLTTGINAPDGIAVDRHDNLWVVANQEDELDVIDPDAKTAQGTLAKVIAKRGDFEGISKDGTIQGLLFPASPAFSPDGQYVYVSNIALFLPFAGSPEPAVDSPWTLQVKHYTIAKIRAEIPPLTDQDEQ